MWPCAVFWRDQFVVAKVKASNRTSFAPDPWHKLRFARFVGRSANAGSRFGWATKASIGECSAFRTSIEALTVGFPKALADYFDSERSLEEAIRRLKGKTAA
jgi:hypothetical protein